MLATISVDAFVQVFGADFLDKEREDEEQGAQGGQESPPDKKPDHPPKINRSASATDASGPEHEERGCEARYFSGPLSEW